MPNSTPKLLAIVWAPDEQRTELLSRRLSAELYHVHFMKYKQPLYAPFKYPLQWMKTWQILFTRRPKFVFVTNPPFIAAYCVWFYCLMSGARMILDTHPPSLYSRKWGWSLPLQRWVALRAYINLTDQIRFKRLFDGWGCPNTIVLERPPKDITTRNITSTVDSNKFEVTVINTFAEDEPLQCVLDAAKIMPDVTFNITGDVAMGNRALIEAGTENCIFTGYLHGDDYWNTLNRSRAVMALTIFPHSLMLSPSEGLVLNKPVIISRQEATTEYFYKGAVFVENTGDSIVAGIREVQRREKELIQETREFLEERQSVWDTNFRALEGLLAN
jgi:hypothetical protein